MYSVRSEARQAGARHGGNWLGGPHRHGVTRTGPWPAGSRALVPVVWVIAWVLGVASLVPQHELPSTASAQAIMAAGLLVAALAAAATVAHTGASGCTGSWSRAWMLPLAVFCSALLLAHGSTALRTQARLNDRLPHALEGHTVIVVGVVAELPRRSPQGTQFILQVESARQLSGEPVRGVPSRVWLGWWREGHIDALLAAGIPEPLPGERWELPVKFKRPHGTQNPGGFDAERWFLEQDLGASGSVTAAHRGHARLLGRAWPAWRHPESWRAAVRARIDAHVEHAAAAGLIAGLTIGDQSAVDAADWQLFRDAGVAHALSISGLHITLFAALAAPAVAWLWRRSPRACLWWPAPFAGAAAGWCFAWAYALLAGWGLPAQRTVAMLAVVTLVRLMRLNWSPMWVWWLAAGPVVVLDPWAVTQAGFWLSFAAVGLLLLSGSDAAAKNDEPTWWVRAGVAVRTQVVTALGLAPLAAACFGQVSVVGVLGNLLALPWITLLLTPLCLLGVVWPPLWVLVPGVMVPLRGLMEALVGMPWAVINVAGSPPWALGLAVLGAALALMNLPVRLRLCGLALMLPHLWPVLERPEHGRFEVWAFDVGQGSAVLVRTQHHALLLDAGPAWGEGRDAGERVVVPVLRHLGVRRLDALVLTHRDLDHAGGAAAVLKAIPAATLLSSLEATHPLRRWPIPHQPCRRGQVWFWDGVRFEVLHPFGTEDPQAKPNHLSCVLRVVDAQGRSLLMTGDIEHEQEAALVQADVGPTPDGETMSLRSHALVVPHHGSRTSSTPPFIDAVGPQWAIAQAGYRNRFGHPVPSVVQTITHAGAQLEVSPDCGAWHWDGQSPPQCWRRVQPRHWHDGPAAPPAPASPPAPAARQQPAAPQAPSG